MFVAITVNSGRWPNIVLMLARSRRRWANIKTELGQRLCLLGEANNLITGWSPKLASSYSVKRSDVTGNRFE